MTEQEWQAAKDPGAMLRFLIFKNDANSRKMRVFAVACSRRIWHLTEERCQKAVEVSERYADGLASVAEVRDADMAIQNYYSGILGDASAACSYAVMPHRLSFGGEF